MSSTIIDETVILRYVLDDDEVLCVEQETLDR